MKRKSKPTHITDELLSKKTNSWDHLSTETEKSARELSDGYIRFLNSAKTERLSVEYIRKKAEQLGFQNLDTLNKPSEMTGKKAFYSINRNKNIFLLKMGTESVSKGLNLCASHIDAPRIDIKQNPLYEDSNIALFKTHYYGGIKKFHWFNIPLALHGVIILQNGKKIPLSVGDQENDPVFVISDLLPHLSRKSQDDKKLGEVFTGEHLNLIVGSRPVPAEKEGRDGKDRIKMYLLRLLYEKYGMREDDFNSAELEIVPAMPARYAGFDRSLIAGYGQDDRICAFATMKALFEVRRPKRCAAVFMADKEEIGSEGVTGMKSDYLIHVISKLLSLTEKGSNDHLLRETLFKTNALSADVDAAVDPTFKDVNDTRNAAYLNRGIVVTKYTGHGGKYMASDANAEYVGKIRSLFLRENIPFQFAQLGKVDQGGGGTVAKDLAKLGMEVLDCGPALLGMHSPYEISSILDLYHSKEAYRAFLENA